MQANDHHLPSGLLSSVPIHSIWDVHESKGYLYCAFAKEDNEYVYWPAVPNVYDTYWSVCLGTRDGHFKRPETDLDALIARFWQTEFAGGWSNSTYALKANYGTYHSWQKLSLQQSVDALESQRTKLEDFLKIIKSPPKSGIHY